MEALIVGIKRLDFKADDGPVKRTQLFLNLPGEDVEGYETGSTSWNELVKGAPPIFGVGEIIEVEYNKKGRLKLVERIEIAPAEAKQGK